MFTTLSTPLETYSVRLFVSDYTLNIFGYSFDNVNIAKDVTTSSFL